MKLTIITTGGTIDKIYFDAKSAYQVGAPQIGDILDAFNVAVEYEIVSLLRKDSLDLTDADRLRIFDAVKESDNHRFVITHGTDTMIETATALQPLGEKNTVLITGALNPARFLGSDATFNIGCAVSAAQTIDNGIYLAMNGRIWDPQNVRKNREMNRFEAID